MTVTNDLTHRSPSGGALALEDRFEVLKEIGDGSFGSVVLGRVRTAGSNIARRGTVVSLAPNRLSHDSNHNHFLGGNQDDEEDLRVFPAVP